MTDPLVILPGFLMDARGFLPQVVHLGADRQIVLPRWPARPSSR